MLSTVLEPTTKRDKRRFKNETALQQCKVHTITNFIIIIIVVVVVIINNQFDVEM